MKDLIILKLSSNKILKGGSGLESDNHIKYNHIIDILIKGQKLRFKYPKNDLCCSIESNNLVSDPEIQKILGNIYDRIILSETENKYIKKNKHKYDKIKIVEGSNVGIKDSLFDSDYEYDQIKKIIGPVNANHFMFKEYDIEIQQRGGFNFNKNKIIYNHKDSDPKLDIVCKLYETESKMIRNYQLKYFHINKNTQFRPFNVNQMFDNIDPFDYLTSLKKLALYHSSGNHYDKLYQIYEEYLKNAQETQIRLNLVDKINVIDRDLIMLEYLKCRPKTFVITLWKPAISGLDKFIELLEKNGSVYYIKTVSLSKQGLRNLLFWYYDDFTYAERLNFIEKKMEYIDTTETNNPVCYILFDNINNKRLSGQGSEFKKELRNKIMEYSGLDDKKYRGNDLLHCNDYWYQTIEYSELLLNQNTVDMLNLQDCRVFSTDNFSIANLKIQTLRNIVYSNISLLESDRLITMGGTVFYSYGIRAFNDIDSIFIDIEPAESHNLIKLVENMFSDKKTKFYFLDAGIKGSVQWNDSWTTKDKKILNYLNINSYKDLVLNPVNYFYHQGLKIVSLDYEMIRKLIRNRTEDHVDFMMINLINPSIIDQYIEIDKDSKDPNKRFIIKESYADIAGPSDDKYPEIKQKILNRRYSKEQIDSVKQNPLFRKFFNK